MREKVMKNLGILDENDRLTLASGNACGETVGAEFPAIEHIAHGIDHPASKLEPLGTPHNRYFSGGQDALHFPRSLHLKRSV
jgi:hypothetical protein